MLKSSLLLISIVVVGLTATTSADECLLTPSKTPLKVIVRSDTALHSRPDPSTASKPVGVFSFFYVLPAEPGGDLREKNGFVRVGIAASGAREAGWLPAKDIVYWSHAQVAGFRKSNDRQRMLFFESKPEAAKWLECPACVEQKAISREPNESGDLKFFPLLDISSVKHQGYPTEIYKVAYLGGPLSQKAQSVTTGQAGGLETRTKTAPTSEQLSAEFKLQIAFCCDSTNSMSEWFESMKVVIERIARELEKRPQLKGRLEFALVTYRDQVDPTDVQAVEEMEYVANVVTDFTTELGHFGKILSTTTVSQVSSEDFPEDVLAGLVASIQDLNWSRTGFKHIILLGDAPAQLATAGYKNVTRQTIDGVLTLAQPSGPNAVWERKQIHGLRVVSEMEEETRNHFSRLTAGRDYAGLHYSYAREKDADKFVEDLLKRLTQLADITDDISSGRGEKVEQLAADQSIDADFRRLLGPPLQMLRAAASKSETQQFTEGYVSTIDPSGNAALEVHALVAQSSLKLFQSALAHCVVALENSGEAGSRDVQKIVQQLQVLATGVSLAEDVHPDMPLEQLLSRALGFPCRSDIFAMTPRKLAAMTSADFAAWVDQVRASQSICEAHVNNTSAWFVLGESGHRAAEKQAFIKVTDLP